MHEKRNFALVLMLSAAAVWAFLVWFMFDQAPHVWLQRIASVALALGFAAWLIYALRFEDKLPDHLEQALGERIYYEADGLSFMPIVRASGGRAELSVYYQNRYENPVDAVVHLRPPERSFIIRDGMRDVHIAFKAEGGDFGVIHQPIAVPRELQGDVIDVQLAAASFYPRSHGARLRRKAGLPCGSLLVDWGGAAFKSGVHEVSGEIDLINPATLHLSMPVGVASQVGGGETWKQARLAGAGSS